MNIKDIQIREWLVTAGILWGGGLLLSAGEHRLADGEGVEAVRPSVYVGGFRELGADLAWIGVYQDWRARDITSLRRGLVWVGTLNPSAQVFWLNGARMLGLDAAAWRRAQAGEASWDRINHDQLGMALAHLDRAQRHHPDAAAIGIERAMLHLRLGQDVAAAEKALAAAQRCGDAPYFVVRVRAELLVKLDRPEEALAVLLAELPHLPKHDPMALVGVVESRVVDLRARIDSKSR